MDHEPDTGELMADPAAVLEHEVVRLRAENERLRALLDKHAPAWRLYMVREPMTREQIAAMYPPRA